MQWKHILLVALFALLVAGLAIQFTQPSVTGAVVAQKPELLRIGYIPIGSDLSFFVAMENGFFEQQGLQVEAIKFESSNTALEAIGAGRLDGTAVVGLEALLAMESRQQGLFKIVEVTPADDTTTIQRILVRPDSAIRGFADLKGKKIGTMPGSVMEAYIHIMVSKYFSPDEVTVVKIKPELQLQALQAGQVDALFSLEPIGTLGEKKGLAKPIIINPLPSHLFNPFPTAAGIVSSKLAREKPEVARRYAEALKAAHRFIREHPAEAKSSLVNFTGIPEDIAPLTGTYAYWSVEQTDRAAVQRAGELYAENKVLTKRVDTSGLYLEP